MAKIAPSWQAFRASETGATAPAVAAITFVLFGFIGLAVDTGTWYLARRELQGAADAAALAAAPFAANPGEANSRAKAMLAANGVPDPDESLISLTTGVWCPEGSWETSARFRADNLQCPNLPDAPRPTAVRLTVRDTGPLILAPLIATGITAPVFNVRATAAQVNMAGLTAGSGVLDINQASGVNAILGALLGTGLNLSALTYQQMLAAQVDVLSLLDALAVKLNLQAGDYEQVLNANATVGQVLDAAVGVLEQQGQTTSISAGLAGAKVIRDLSLNAPNQSVKVGKLLNVGVWKDMPVGQARPTALTAGVDLLQLASASLQVANGANALTLAAPIDLGVVKVGLESTLIEPPQTAYFTFGPEGTRVRTAQARVLLTAKIDLLVVKGDLPVYVEAGAGDAEITAISCQGDPRNDTRVDVAGRASAVALHVGRPNAAGMNLMRNFTQPVAAVNITPAEVDVIGLAKVQVGTNTYIGQRADALQFRQPAGSAPLPPVLTKVGFIGRSATPTDPGSQAIPARAGGSVGLSVDDLTLNTCTVFTGCLPIGAAVSGVLKPVLTTVLGLLNPLISGLLTGLGIHLGYVDVTVPGVRCGQAVLVE
ncbi:pilus assembly protein TadG-related protein [Caulobacter segnis]|uniref:pilus assembly protein TadG-related protein n=1 Tax=Caulobacter segnis TaxID=88688 RepID=UPI00240FABF6|nr:pilus assembly protein TadG-related protein [Caulobacter segnis]MDG2520733.1 pilus assembly protein TadG-related protein [Caulobacter segnis]